MKTALYIAIVAIFFSCGSSKKNIHTESEYSKTSSFNLSDSSRIKELSIIETTGYLKGKIRGVKTEYDSSLPIIHATGLPPVKSRTEFEIDVEEGAERKESHAKEEETGADLSVDTKEKMLEKKFLIEEKESSIKDWKGLIWSVVVLLVCVGLFWLIRSFRK